MKALLSFYVGTERNRFNEQMHPGFVSLGLQDIREFLLKWYDGYTEFDTTGGWLNNSGTAIIEDGAKFEVLVEYASDETLTKETHDNAAKLAEMLDQASVLYSITPVMLFASAP